MLTGEEGGNYYEFLDEVRQFMSGADNVFDLLQNLLTDTTDGSADVDVNDLVSSVFCHKNAGEVPAFISEAMSALSGLVDLADTALQTEMPAEFVDTFPCDTDIVSYLFEEASNMVTDFYAAGTREDICSTVYNFRDSMKHAVNDKCDVDRIVPFVERLIVGGDHDGQGDIDMGALLFRSLIPSIKKTTNRLTDFLNSFEMDNCVLPA
jgi:hypothetical protein